MIKEKFLPLTLLVFSLITSSCGKKANDSIPSSTIGGTTTIESRPVPNHKTKNLDLGIAESFSVFAYTSISSAPTSSIAGKVGLKPGIRSLITLNPATEVNGGSVEIYAGDDVGDHQSYLTMAREDVISAYKEAAARIVDKDKMEVFKGDVAGKILPAGVYHWSKNLVIKNDLTLEGLDSDVWIFQIDGDLELASNSRIVLSGGAQSKNIYWQVSGKILLGNNSVMNGTMMNQLSFEMRPNAQINGRAFAKNGKIIMSQNTIIKP